MRAEDRFAERLARRLRKDLPQYAVEPHGNLIYRLSIGTDGKVTPKSITDPKRGQFAFQTDILVSRKRSKLPLLAIEVKLKYSSHGVMTYSSKAQQHKEVFPFLRYGFLVSEHSKIDGRFFRHNAGLDFAFAMMSQSSEYPEFLKLIRRQLRAAQKLIGVLSHGKPTYRFETSVQISRH